MKKPSVIRRMYARHLMFEVIRSIELAYDQKRVYDHEWNKKQLKKLLDDFGWLNNQFEKMKDYIMEQHLVVKKADKSEDILPAYGTDVIRVLAMVSSYLEHYKTNPALAEFTYREKRSICQPIDDFEAIRLHFCLDDGDAIDPVKYTELLMGHTRELMELPEQLHVNSENIDQCSAQVRAAASIMYLDYLAYLTNIINEIL